MLKNKLLLAIVGVLILGSFASYYFLNKSSSKKPITSLYWTAKQVGNNEIDVYLGGKESEKVSGYDLVVVFDNSNIHVSKTENGGFFPDPLDIKMDSNKLSYSQIKNPESKVDADPNLPILKLFLAPNKLAGYKFKILPESGVYISGLGGSIPKPSEIVLK